MKKISVLAILIVFMFSVLALAVDRGEMTKKYKVFVLSTNAGITEEAEVHIGERAVLKFYSTTENPDNNALSRAQFTSGRLGQMIRDGSKLSEILPDIIENRVVGRVGDEIVFTLDKEDAVGSGVPEVILGFDFANQVRQAFEGTALQEQYLDFLIYKWKLREDRVEIKVSNDICELYMNNKLIARLAGSGDVRLAFKRAASMSYYVQKAIIEQIDPGNFTPGITKDDNSKDLYIGRLKGKKIFSVNSADAKLNNTGEYKLVMKWITSIREALGARAYTYTTAKSMFSQSGIASWYGPGFHGRTTSNRERYDMYGYTAAHKSLPFGSEVLVTNMNNKKHILVRVNDRGPYIAGRIIDLTKTAAEALGINGLAKVRIDVINGPKKRMDRYNYLVEKNLFKPE